MIEIIQKLAKELLSQELKLACAESCTGGLVAKMCTDLSGSSQWFERAFITYSNEAKHDMLGVDKELIKIHGAVSQTVVEQMVSGALQHSQADVALAITGIAGPGGGSTEKPVGTVWIACATGQNFVSERYLFTGDREQVRLQSASTALSNCVQLLEQGKSNQ